MNIKYININYIIFILFSVFCGNIFAAVPDWYNEPITDTNIHFYGKGSGLNLKEATIMALGNIADRITSNNNDLRINFPNYELEKIEKDGKYFYIILSVAKAELFSQQIKDLEDINKKIRDNIDFLEDKNDFVKLIKFTEIENIITEAKNKIKTINIIDKFDDRNYIKYYKSIEDKKNKLSNNFKIEIVFLSESIANLREDVSALLKSNNIEIANNSDNILYINSLVEKEQIEGKFFVELIFQFKLVCNGKLANYDSYSYNSHSEISFDIAMENCINEFKKDIINNQIKFSYYE